MTTIEKQSILSEVRELTSAAVAKKQKNAEIRYPKIIEKIKEAASRGETSCEFQDHEIDDYVKRLLNVDGFKAYATSKTLPRNDYKAYYDNNTITIWVVSW